MVNDNNRLWEEAHKYPEGTMFEGMDRSQQFIRTSELISTTQEGDDLLGELSKEDAKEIREIYAESIAAHEITGVMM